MPDLDAVESLILENPQLRFGSVVAQMCRHGQAADVVHQPRDVSELRQGLFHVGCPAPAEVAPKRVADVVTGAAVDERARDMRTSQRAIVAATELRLHVFQLDRDAEALQLCDDLLATAPARGTRVAQEHLEPLVLLWQEQR